MNLDELQTVRDRERQTDKLQQLRESFYADAGELIQQLRQERDRAATEADDPFDAPTVTQLTDEIQTAEQMVQAIYEKRIGKIVKAASFDAAGLPAEADGMTVEEQELFDRLVDDIERNRDRVFTVIDGRSGDEADSAVEGIDPVPPRSGADESVPAAAAMGGTDSPTDADADRSDHDPPAPPGGDAGNAPDDDVHPDESPTGGDASWEVGGSGESGEESGGSREAGGEAGNSGDASGEAGNSGEADRKSESGRDAGEQSPGASRADGRGASERGDSRNDRAPGGEPEPADDRPNHSPSDGAQARETGVPREEPAAVERKTVLMTESVETFVGIDDRDYDLEENDVVSLPATNADLLLEQDIARELD